MAEPSIPTQVLVDWLNEQVTILNTEQGKLREFLARNPSLDNDPRITAKIGQLGGRDKLLKDFTGFLESQALDQLGRLDTIEHFLTDE